MTKNGDELKNDFLAFSASLEAESDRGCALYSAAYLDDALADMLMAGMVQTATLKDDLFGRRAALAAFSSRIKAAYYLGKITVDQMKDLDRVRDIRNDFAHRATSLDFNDQSIRDRCRNFHSLWLLDLDKLSPRQMFTFSVASLLAKIHAMILDAKPIDEGRTLPKEVILGKFKEFAGGDGEKFMRKDPLQQG